MMGHDEPCTCPACVPWRMVIYHGDLRHADVITDSETLYQEVSLPYRIICEPDRGRLPDVPSWATKVWVIRGKDFLRLMEETSAVPAPHRDASVVTARIDNGLYVYYGVTEITEFLEEPHWTVLTLTNGDELIVDEVMTWMRDGEVHEWM